MSFEQEENPNDKFKLLLAYILLVVAIIGGVAGVTWNAKRTTIGEIQKADNTKININGNQRNELKEMEGN